MDEQVSARHQRFLGYNTCERRRWKAGGLPPEIFDLLAIAIIEKIAIESPERHSKRG